MATTLTKRRSTSRPLACIPSSEVVNERLRAASLEIKQLRILLRTAREIERAAAERADEQEVQRA